MAGPITVSFYQKDRKREKKGEEKPEISFQSAVLYAEGKLVILSVYFMIAL